MKVGIDIRALGARRTGDEVYIRHIVEAIKRQPYIDKQYYLFTDTVHWPNIPELQNLPDHVYVVPLTPGVKLIWTMYLLPRACYLYEIDVLHVMYITPLLFLPPYTKIITTVHDISWKFVPEYIPLKDKLILNCLIPLSLRKAHTILTVSKHAKESIHQIFSTPREKITVVYNGGYLEQDISSVTLSSAVQDIVSKEYLLYLGSLQPRKNIPALIRGFARYREQYTNNRVYLVIAGGKGYNYDSGIDQAIEECGVEDYVIMPGYVSDEEKFILLRSARIFLFLSLYEGFGIPPIEAMSVKTPVIVSQASCLPEIVDKGGVIVDERNEDEVAQAIYTLNDHPYKRQHYQEHGLARAQDFQWSTMEDSILEIYSHMKDR